MTSIVELPTRIKTNTKRVIDRRDEFLSKIQESQFITYSLEYFTSCFQTDQRNLKAVHVRLYNLHQDQRPQIDHYMISWEDVPNDEDDNWLDFQMKVNFQLKEFLSELKLNSNIVEGSL
ncbi:MAG: hypothetical protein FK730_16880 [Asgard group archaeon]|nr:hypothetical protein [Asgard group archaeon]